jgi:glycosyltransferase involved in cell wall biosynthesis
MKNEGVRSRPVNLVTTRSAMAPRLPDRELTIIVPVYCNAPTLEPLVHRIHGALDAERVDHIVLLVDDDSRDDAWRIIHAICDRDSRVAGAKLDRNYGQHAAILVGLALARGTWIAVMDADLQDPPEALPALLREAKATGTTVFGARRARHGSWLRSASSAAYKLLLALVAGVPRGCGTFFVVPAAVADRVTRYHVSRPQVLVMACRASSRVTTLRYERDARQIGGSAYDLRRLVVAARNGIQCAYECSRESARSPGTTRSWGSIDELAGTAWHRATH